MKMVDLTPLVEGSSGGDDDKVRLGPRGGLPSRPSLGSVYNSYDKAAERLCKAVAKKHGMSPGLLMALYLQGQNKMREVLGEKTRPVVDPDEEEIPF